MRTTIALLTVIAFVAASFVGCAQRIGDFTLISTKNVDIGGKYKKLDGRYTGEDAKGMLLFIPLGTPNLKTAVDNCIENGKGELITNAVLESSFWTAIVWSEQKFVVTGDVWTKAGTADLLNPQVKIYELRSTSEGLNLVCLTDPSNKVKVDYLASR